MKPDEGETAPPPDEEAVLKVADGAEDAEAPEEPSGFPFTFGGVASFAQTGWSRLLAWQAAIALTIVGGALLVLGQHWAQVVDHAIEDHLPKQSGLKAGELVWPNDDPQVFARNAYLCVLVDPEARKDHGQLADVQIELRRSSWVCRSVFGQIEYDYLEDNVPITREQFVPWWGSRRPFILLASGVGVGVTGWLAWLFLGFVLAWPLKLFAYFADRESGVGSVWRAAAAAFLPASALLAMGILCYAMRLLPLMGLLVLVPVHLGISLVYLLGAGFRLRRVEEKTVDPFGELDEGGEWDRDEEGSSIVQPENPFVEVKDEDG